MNDQKNNTYQKHEKTPTPNDSKETQDDKKVLPHDSKPAEKPVSLHSN